MSEGVWGGEGEGGGGNNSNIVTKFVFHISISGKTIPTTNNNNNKWSFFFKSENPERQ